MSALFSLTAFEIACNVYASNLEVREKKSMMSGFLAFWSLGVLYGSLITSFLLEWNYSFISHIILYVIILLPLSLYFVLCLEPQSEIKSEELSKKKYFFYLAITYFFISFNCNGKCFE